MAPLLVRDKTRPGLWTRTDWTPNEPGTFAVIIGISLYNHLAGGAGQQALEQYDLPQLQVSAQTAYRFFQWLQDEYQCPDGLPAKCWLLLAPTKEEIQHEMQITEHMDSPSFQNIDTAVREWFSCMENLSADIAAKSRAIFFFSGHGIEITQNNQLLFPCNYLEPPSPPVLDRAVSTENLWKGLAALYVPNQFFFVDACRNDHDKLRNLEIRGTPILNEPRARGTRPRNSPILYASASGSQAWQPNSPKDGPSFYGRALLEGLRAFPQVRIDRDQRPWPVTVPPLHEYVHNRALGLLRAKAPTLDQIVTQGGTLKDAYPLVTEVNPGPLEHPSGPDPFGRATTLIEKHSDQSATISRPPHDFFGSERMEEIWYSAELFNLLDKERKELGNDFVITKVARNRDVRISEFSIKMLNPGRHWLKVTDARDKSYATLLPGSSQAVNYVVRMQLEFSTHPNLNSSPRYLSRMDVKIGEDSPKHFGALAKIWELYRSGKLGGAIQDIKGNGTRILKAMAPDDLPFAATLFSTIILHTYDYDLLDQVLSLLDDKHIQNLAFDFPDIYAVLAERSLRSPTGNSKTNAQTALTYLLEIKKLGLPYFSETLPLLPSLIKYALDFASPSVYQARALHILNSKVTRAMRHYRSGGLFLVLHGASAEISPSLVLNRTVRSYRTEPTQGGEGMMQAGSAG